MPVSTVSTDQVAYVNGRPTIVTKPTHNASRHSSPDVNKYQCRAQQRIPRLDLVTPGSPVAVDCEGLIPPQEKGWRRHGVGRLSIVNVDGQVVYDTFVYYPGVEHRPSPPRLRMEVRFKDILPANGAQKHTEALADARAIFDKSGIVVAHSAANDERMLLGIDFSDYVVRDTQDFDECRQLNGGQPPGLAMLAADVLERSIQVEEHSSIEDARATMDLFLLHHEEYEDGLDYAGKPLDSDTCAVASGLPTTGTRMLGASQ